MLARQYVPHLVLLAPLVLISCGNNDLKAKADVTFRRMFDDMQGKVKMDPGDALSAMYADEVTFIRVSPKPRIWATFRDVRLRRTNVFGDWLLDDDYLNRVILKRINATNFEVAVPVAGVLPDAPNALRGTYQRKTRIIARVGRRIMKRDVERPRVLRVTDEEPWSLDWTALARHFGGRPNAVFIVFPIAD